MAEIDTSIIRRVRATLKEIQASIYATLEDVFNKYPDVLADIVTENQLFNKGEDGMGISIHPDYADLTIDFKIEKKQPFDRVTLKDTGAFYRSIDAEAKGGQLIISSSIERAADLMEKYGPDILGIQDEEMKAFFEKFVIPDLRKNIGEIIERNKI